MKSFIEKNIDLFRVKQYRNENDALTVKIEKSEVEVNELIQINEVNFLFI